MNSTADESRRKLLKNIAMGLALVPAAAPLLRGALAADLPPVTPDDPTAKAVKYVSDASKAIGAKPGSKCASCTLYQGTATSDQGGCALFPGKSVKANGWCTSWTAKA